MNRVLHLYPRAWRYRYLDEVADLLAERPPSLRDQFDLARGALDAWLHPQVIRASSADDAEPVMKPIGVAALTVVGGILWVVGGIVQFAGGWDPETGYKHAEGVMIVIAAAFLSAIAALVRSWSEPRVSIGMRRSAIAMFLLVLLTAAPWPIMVIGYWGTLVATMAFGRMLALGGLRTGTVLVIGALVATMFNTESDLALAAVPLGVAWIAVVIESTMRGRVPSAPGVPAG